MKGHARRYGDRHSKGGEIVSRSLGDEGIAWHSLAELPAFHTTRVVGVHILKQRLCVARIPRASRRVVTRP